MQTLPLVPHPDNAGAAVTSIAAEINMLGARQVAVRFDISADFRVLRWPIETRPTRVEGLWRHTCFEVFLKPEDGEEYLEFNLSPSGEWAAWSLSGYRSDMKEARGVSPPRIVPRHPQPEKRQIFATLDFRKSPHLGSGSALTVGLSAVIEERNGRLSYWALAHPPGRPDFHHQACFAATLPPMSAE